MGGKLVMSRCEGWRGAGWWRWPVMGLCRVMLACVGLVLAVWVLIFHLLGFLFIPLFAAVDWLVPSRRERARRTMRFLYANRPRLRIAKGGLGIVRAPRRSRSEA